MEWCYYYKCKITEDEKRLCKEKLNKNLPLDYNPCVGCCSYGWKQDDFILEEKREEIDSMRWCKYHKSEVISSIEEWCRETEDKIDVPCLCDTCEYCEERDFKTYSK